MKEELLAPTAVDDEHADLETRERIALARHVREVPHKRRLPAPHRCTVPRGFLASAAATPAAPFLIWRGEDERDRHAFCYRGFAAEIDRAALFLHDELGLRTGDRIATASSNHPATVLACFAAWRLGVTVTPINVNEDDARVRFIAEDAAARAILVRPDLCARIAAATEGLPGLRHRVALDLGGDLRPLDARAPAGWRGLSECSPARADTAKAALARVPLPSPDDEALIVYTSGTTGMPKGVSLDQYDLAVDAWSIARWHGIGPDSRMMCVLPIHHVNGTVVTLVTPALAGASVVLNPRVRTADFWHAVAEHRVEVVSVVPTLLQFLLQGEGAAGGPPSGFRHPICGAGPLTVDLGARWEERFGRPVMHGYGLSETTCYSCFLPVDQTRDEHSHWMRAHGFPSIGAPIESNEMAIHDPMGNPLPAGERGEIVIRGHNVMRGYHRRPDANAAAFAHGWFRSGDEGFFEEAPDGRPYFFITGRLKELIIRGGVKIAPLEVDEVLMAMPGVRAGLAVGFENRWYGEEVGAYVRRDDGPDGRSLTAEGVLEWCRARLPFHKRPKAVVFGDEVPVTSTGKYQRGKLKALFREWEGVQFRDR